MTDHPTLCPTCRGWNLYSYDGLQHYVCGDCLAWGRIVLEEDEDQKYNREQRIHSGMSWFETRPPEATE